MDGNLSGGLGGAIVGRTAAVEVGVDKLVWALHARAAMKKIQHIKKK
jgi:hypothetical protein